MAQVTGTVSTPITSKINFVAVVSFLVSLAAVFGIVIPADIQDAAIKIVALGAPVITFILRTWFTVKK